MSKKAARWISLISLALSALTLSELAAGQSGPPEKDRGVARRELAVIDLGTEIDGMAGRVMRQHRTTLEPGGAIRLHDHVDRPEILFILEGKLTDHQGSESKEYAAGESYVVGKSNKHWLENRGTVPATFVGTTILKKP